MCVNLELRAPFGYTSGMNAKLVKFVRRYVRTLFGVRGPHVERFIRKTVAGMNAAPLRAWKEGAARQMRERALQNEQPRGKEEAGG
jgi:hypothetical protein